MDAQNWHDNRTKFHEKQSGRSKVTEEGAENMIMWRAARKPEWLSEIRVDFLGNEQRSLNNGLPWD
jgi:hypothetical protein